jgi:HEAT repeat protein
LSFNKFIVKDIHDYEVLEDYFNKKDIQGVLKGLHHWNRDLRDRAAFYLGELGDQEAIEPLKRHRKLKSMIFALLPRLQARVEL